MITNAPTTRSNVTAGGALSGGPRRARSAGDRATIALRLANVTVNEADVTLSGTGSVPRVTTATTGVMCTLDQTLQTNRGATTFTNEASGLIALSNGRFSANALADDGTLIGCGTSAVYIPAGNRITGTGAIVADTGTLTLSRAVNLGAGSCLTSSPGATIGLVGATASSRVATLVNDGSIALGAQNLVVRKDYANANLDVGNAFDRRAGVSGAGEIAGRNVGIALTGAAIVSGPDARAPDFGAVHGDTMVPRSFGTADTGTGTDIRGALQTGETAGRSPTRARSAAA